jgi:hypothetical protein
LMICKISASAPASDYNWIFARGCVLYE